MPEANLDHIKQALYGESEALDSIECSSKLTLPRNIENSSEEEIYKWKIEQVLISVSSLNEGQVLTIDLERPEIKDPPNIIPAAKSFFSVTKIGKQYTFRITSPEGVKTFPNLAEVAIKSLLQRVIKPEFKSIVLGDYRSTLYKSQEQESEDLLFKARQNVIKLRKLEESDFESLIEEGQLKSGQEEELFNKITRMLVQLHDKKGFQEKFSKYGKYLNAEDKESILSYCITNGMMDLAIFVIDNEQGNNFQEKCSKFDFVNEIIAVIPIIHELLQQRRINEVKSYIEIQEGRENWVGIENIILTGINKGFLDLNNAQELIELYSIDKEEIISKLLAISVDSRNTQMLTQIIDVFGMGNLKDIKFGGVNLFSLSLVMKDKYLFDWLIERGEDPRDYIDLRDRTFLENLYEILETMNPVEDEFYQYLQGKLSQRLKEVEKSRDITSQERVIKALNKFLGADVIHKEGACNGFSFLHAYARWITNQPGESSKKDDIAWFNRCLKNALNWENLSEPETKELERFASLIQTYYKPEVVFKSTNQLDQSTSFADVRSYSEESNGIHYHSTTGILSDSESIIGVLKELPDQSVINFSSPRHVIDVYKEDGKYYFYNSDAAHGENEFIEEELDTLVKKLKVGLKITDDKHAITVQKFNFGMKTLAVEENIEREKRHFIDNILKNPEIDETSLHSVIYAMIAANDPYVEEALDFVAGNSSEKLKFGTVNKAIYVHIATKLEDDQSIDFIKNLFERYRIKLNSDSLGAVMSYALRHCDNIELINYLMEQNKDVNYLQKLYNTLMYLKPEEKDGSVKNVVKSLKVLSALFEKVTYDENLMEEFKNVLYSDNVEHKYIRDFFILAIIEDPKIVTDECLNELLKDFGQIDLSEEENGYVKELGAHIYIIKCERMLENVSQLSLEEVNAINEKLSQFESLNDPNDLKDKLQNMQERMLVLKHNIEFRDQAKTRLDGMSDKAKGRASGKLWKAVHDYCNEHLSAEKPFSFKTIVSELNKENLAQEALHRRSTGIKAVSGRKGTNTEDVKTIKGLRDLHQNAYDNAREKYGDKAKLFQEAVQQDQEVIKNRGRFDRTK